MAGPCLHLLHGFRKLGILILIIIVYFNSNLKRERHVCTVAQNFARCQPSDPNTAAKEWDA